MTKEDETGGVTIGNVSGGIHDSIIAGRDATVNTPLRGQNEKTNPASQEKRMIKILFLAANPSNTTRLRVDEESRAIDQSLRQAEFREFDIEKHYAVRVADLQGLLLRHQPDIVHFSGHGSESNEIILEDNAGNSHPVSDRALSQLFSILKDNVQCVVLNACYSETQAQAIAQHIDCVIGMSQAIGEKAAISFASAFYQALGYGRDLKTAFELGRLQIDMENLGEEDAPKLLAVKANPLEIIFANSGKEPPESLEAADEDKRFVAVDSQDRAVDNKSKLATQIEADDVQHQHQSMPDKESQMFQSGINSATRLIREAIKAVPAVRYALGIAGIAAALAIVITLFRDLRIALFGTVLMLFLMVVLVVFAHLTRQGPKPFRLPMIILTWSSVLLMIATALLLVTSTFFGWPVDIRSTFFGLTPNSVLSNTLQLPQDVSQIEILDGDFNIAIAQFGQVTAGEITTSTVTTQISESLYNFLDSEYEAVDFGVDVQVAHIPNLIRGDDAEDLADKINADMLIYGTVYVDGQSAEFSPRFHIAEHSDTKEITGQSRLEVPIPFTITQLMHQNEVNKELRTRAAILVSFTKGLVYIRANNLNGAQFSFQKAIKKAEEGKPFPGQEVLYLLMAMTDLLQKEYDKTGEYLDTAFERNPNYARAHLVRGNIYYDQYVQDWRDSSLLDRAQAEYEKALNASDRPPNAYIDEKVNISLGNIWVIRAQETISSSLFAKAISYYNQVIASYENEKTKNETTRGLAATAYMGLGVVYERQEDYAKAVDAYQHCINFASTSELESKCKEQFNKIHRE